MSPEGPFSGFPDEAIQFLADLRENNNREWFQPRKQIYQDAVVAPAQDFVRDLGERLKGISTGIAYDTATNGTGSIMRIYRDLRFTKDKRPYKTYLGIRFWEGASKKGGPGFHVGIEPEGARVYSGIHMFPKPLLTAYRDAVGQEKQGRALEKALAKVTSSGRYEIGGEHYQRVPRGFDAEHPRADLLRHNALWALSPTIDVDVITRPHFAQECFEHCLNMAPLHHWLVKLDQRSAT